MSDRGDGSLTFYVDIDSTGAQAGVKDIEKVTTKMANRISRIGANVKESLRGIFSSGFDENTVDTVQDKVDRLSDSLKSLEGKGLSFGDIEYDTAYKEYILANKELKEYKKA